MEEEISQLHAVIQGRVQGVFFRATTKEMAQELGLVGTVKNLPNGTVEIYAQGKKKALETLLNQLDSNQGPGSIESIQKNYSKPSLHFEGFRITYD